MSKPEKVRVKMRTYQGPLIETSPLYKDGHVTFVLVAVPGDKAVAGMKNAIKNFNSRYQSRLVMRIDRRRVTIEGDDPHLLANAVEFLEVQEMEKEPKVTEKNTQGKASSKKIVTVPQKRIARKQFVLQPSL